MLTYCFQHSVNRYENVLLAQYIEHRGNACNGRDRDWTEKISERELALH